MKHKSIWHILLADDPPAGADGDAPFRVAFVYVSPLGDMGWTWAHNQGRLAVEQEFGDRVETAFVENVPDGPEAERVIRNFAQNDYDLIITTSFGYMDSTIEVAQEFPETWFVHISGYKTADNVSTVFGRIYQPRYLSGWWLDRLPKATSSAMSPPSPFPK
jgi:basic membrane protein A and related proteins